MIILNLFFYIYIQYYSLQINIYNFILLYIKISKNYIIYIIFIFNTKCARYKFIN